MRKWKVKLPGGRVFEVESNDPGRELIEQGYTEFALTEIVPPKPEQRLRPGPLAVNITEAARMCSVSRNTMRKWMRRPGFPATRIDGCTRIMVDALRAWMEAQISG